MSTKPIYSLSVAEVYQALETNPGGLSLAEADMRLSLYGRNLLSRQTKSPFFEKLIREFMHPSAVVLLCIGLVALLQTDAVLAFIIWGIVVINTSLSFWREYRAEQAVEKLSDILPSFQRSFL